jgi:hypothetical protein
MRLIRCFNESRQSLPNAANFLAAGFEDSRRFKDLHRKPANHDHAVKLKLPDDFLGCKFRVSFRREIIRRHEARCRPAQDERAGTLMRGDGRAPMSRPALVGHD